MFIFYLIEIVFTNSDMCYKTTHLLQANNLQFFQIGQPKEWSSLDSCQLIRLNISTIKKKEAECKHVD